MKGKVGIWLDHRRAVILAISDEGQETKFLFSGVLKQPRAGHRNPMDVSQQDALDRQFKQQMDKFFEDILPFIRDAEAIHIFGPGEAKKELEAKMKKEGLKNCIMEVSTMDKMTDRQLIAAMKKNMTD